MNIIWDFMASIYRHPWTDPTFPVVLTGYLMGVITGNM